MKTAKPDKIVQVRPALLARPSAAAFLSISEGLLDQLVARGELPKPRRISAGRSAWLTDELDAWSRGRPVSDLLPPAGSGYGRAGKVAA